MAKPSGGIELDDAVFKHKIRKMLKRLKVDEAEFVREEGAFLARDLAKYAPPHARFPKINRASIGTAKDKKAGESAIRADLNKIFFVPDDNAVYLWAKKAFPAGAIHTHKGRVGAGVATSLAEMKKHHDKFRLRKGRVIRVDKSQRLWVSERLFKRYWNQEKKKVGMAKASLAKAAVRINPKIRVPAWVKRHIVSVTGSGRVTKRENSPTAYISAKAAGLQNINSFTIGLVKKHRSKAMESKLNNMVKHGAKKSGFKVR